MTLVDRLLELHQMWVEYINEVGKVPTDEEIKDIESIKKQLEEIEVKYQILKSGLEEIINQTEFEDADEATANLLVFPKLRKLLEKVK